MFFRVIVASFFIGIAAITQLLTSDSYVTKKLVYIYILTGGVYLCTFIYVFCLPFIKSLKRFAFIQIFMDLLLVTFLVYVTGGISSIFSFMYSISIIAASILLYIFGGILTATFSSLFYTLLVVFQDSGLVAPMEKSSIVVSGYAGSPLYFPIIVNISAFYLVAFLSSFIAQQAKKSKMQLQEKQIDIENLEVLNENIIQSINSGLMTLDMTGKIITFNKAAEEITGLLHYQVYLKSIEEVFPGVNAVLSIYETRDGSKLQNPRFEKVFVRQDGKSLSLGFALSILRDKFDKELGMILSFQDLTRIKEMQEYIQRMDRLAAVGRLAAGIAHEIRNPLASISGSIQVLRKDLDLQEENRRLMDIIVRESNNLSHLISDFAQFVKPVKHEKEMVVLKDLVDDVLAMFQNSPEAKAIASIRQTIDTTTTVWTSPQLITQVLWNLIINAAHAVDSGRGTIVISAREMESGFQPPMDLQRFKDAADGGAGWLELKVEDNGKGIPETDIDKIFDPFFTTKDSGTGLGLSIVHKIIQELGGTIAASARPDQGTVFCMYLPLSNRA